MKKFLRIALAVALIVMSLTSVMGTVVAADELTADTAVAAIGTTYYASLDEAIDAAQDGDVISLLKDTTASVKNIAAKKITIKGEGTTKPVIAAGSAKCAFWLKDGSELTLENIAFKEFASKNVILYGTQDAADSNTFKLTIDNCEFEFSASGAIYAYNCAQAEIKVTNSSFKSLSNAAAHSAFNAGRVPTVATYTKFENNTLVGCGQEINTGSQGVHKSLDELYPVTVPEGTIASVTVNGGAATNCTTFDELYALMNRNAGVVEVTVYTDVTFERPVVVLNELTVKAATGVTPTVTVEISKASKNNGNDSTAYKGGFIFASASKKLTFKDIKVDVKESTMAADTTKGGASLVMLNSTNEATVWAGHSEVIFDNATVTSVGAVINQYGTGESANCYVTVKDSTITAAGDFIEAARSTKAGKFAFNLTVEGNTTLDVANVYSAPANSTENYITYAKNVYVACDGTTTYYDTFDAALDYVKTNNLANATIVVFTNQSVAAAAEDFACNNLTIKGASETVTLTMGKKAFFIKDSTITFANLKINFTAGDAIYAEAVCEIDLTFNNVDFSMSSNYTIEVANTVIGASFTFVDCTVNYSNPTFASGSPSYFMYLGKVQSTVNITNMVTNVPVVKATATPAITYTITGINQITFGEETSSPLFIAGADDAGIISKEYGDDATAKLFGYTHRVGATEGGKVDEVYFVDEGEAKAVAMEVNAPVFELETGAAVYCPHAPADNGVVDPAPTCTTEGTVTHTCTLCGATYTEAVAVVPHADSDNDGDHKCDTCDYVFENACADADNNYKCDECGADCGEAPADTTPADTKPADTAKPADEKKGCGGTVTVAGLALVAALGSCAIFVEKKRK